MSKPIVGALIIDHRMVWKITYFFSITASAYTILCSNAFALSGFTPVGIVLCNVVTMIWSDIGRGLATIAVMTVGIMASLGKASWGQALMLAVGISLVFGAPVVVPQLVYGKGALSSMLSGLVASCV